MFLGYSVTQKGYKIFNLSTQQVMVFRDVVFHERHFPFHIQSQVTSGIAEPIFVPAATCDIFDEGYTSYISAPIPASSSSTNTLHPDASCSLSDPLSPAITTTPILTPPTTPLSSTSPPTTTLVDISNLLPSQPAPPLRISTRTHYPPSYLKDYHCHTATNTLTTPPTHWCNLVAASSYPASHQAFLASPSLQVQEPLNYTEAASKPEWVLAMQKEIQALHDNETWELVDLPKGKKPIGNKWVYKVKLKSDGSLERCKARLVAKGYNQRFGIDYEETFSPVVKMPTIRCIIALAASKKWPIYQLDVNNAFLHGDLHEEVFMKVPSGVPNPHNEVCRLKKSLYGLKQASRQWFAKLVSALTSHGFTQSKNDYSMFIKKKDHHITIAAIYVDDILLTGTDSFTIDELKAFLHHSFSIKDLGLLHYFLGIEVGYLPEGILLTQHKFTREILSDYGFDISKPTTTPLPLNLKLQADSGTLLPDPEVYRSIVGKLNFLTNTRPDLAYTVQSLSQFMQKPRSSHLAALQHTLRFVQATAGQGILLQGNNHLHLQAFSDSDWAACLTLEDLSQAISCCLATHLSLGDLRSKGQLVNLLMKLNTEQWHLQLQK